MRDVRLKDVRLMMQETRRKTNRHNEYITDNHAYTKCLFAIIILLFGTRYLLLVTCNS